MTETAQLPAARMWTLRDRNDGTFTFEGRLLGEGSSERPEKTRWFEVAIYRREGHTTYVLHTCGRSTEPGERSLPRVILTRSAYEVVERLTVHHNGKTYVPRASTIALAQAAQFDEALRDAYVNRAVR